MPCHKSVTVQKCVMTHFLGLTSTLEEMFRQDNPPAADLEVANWGASGGKIKYLDSHFHENDINGFVLKILAIFISKIALNQFF